jgi:hypothetical protein
MTDWTNSWLLGADGLHRSRDGAEWEVIGGHGYPVNDLIRQSGRLVCATLWGLWEVGWERPRWVQLHDETLTEVLAIAPTAGDPGVVAVSAYGLAFGRRGEHGATRWRSCSDGLSPNERFSSTVLARPDAPEEWLVGTENGVLIYSEVDDCWHRTDLKGRPCRALLHAFDCLWAGTDEGGVWRSADGYSWQRAGAGFDSGTVFSLSATADRILAGSLRGICVGDGDSSWQRHGPSLLVSAIAAHPDVDGPWLAGATPGGLWRSDDVGEHWRQIGGFDSVRVIVPPEVNE